MNKRPAPHVQVTAAGLQTRRQLAVPGRSSALRSLRSCSRRAPVHEKSLQHPTAASPARRSGASTALPISLLCRSAPVSALVRAPGTKNFPWRHHNDRSKGGGLPPVRSAASRDATAPADLVKTAPARSHAAAAVQISGAGLRAPSPRGGDGAAAAPDLDLYVTQICEAAEVGDCERLGRLLKGPRNPPGCRSNQLAAAGCTFSRSLPISCPTVCFQPPPSLRPLQAPAFASSTR